MAGDPFQSGRRVSWWAAVVTGVAAVATVFWLRDGTPAAAGFDERTAFIAAHRGAWLFACLVRMLCASLVLAFLISLSRTLTPGHPILRSVAVQLVTIGAAAELFAFTLAAVVLPPLAGRSAGGEVEIRLAVETLEGVVVALSGVLGAGLTGVGGALIAHAAARTPPFPSALAFSSLLVWGSAIVVAGATFSGSARGLDLHTLLFLPLLTLWIAAVAASHFRPPVGTR